MKRRNGDCVKLRRSLKRCKIDGVYGSAFLYVKFLLVWALVMTMDFLLQFRFEYLWPVWLLLRSVSDSFRYQGLAFSVFFVCISITSDVICYLFIPVQLLFFAASTYVWVQYVWQTDRGFYPPTILLWIFFVYFESCVRMREDYRPPQPFHIDLCRPFAAHCIGYPVITLGFGVKSYVSYKLRLRKQKVVGKDNEYYVQLLQQALPPELEDADKQQGALHSRTNGEVISNGGVKKGDVKKSLDDSDFLERRLSGRGGEEGEDSEDEDEGESGSEDTTCKVFKVNGVNNSKENKAANDAMVVVHRKGKMPNTVSQSTNKDDTITRLEADLRRLKSDLQSCRTCEQELRSQISNLVIADKSMKSEIYQLQQDNENLQTKLQNSTANRQRDKQMVAVLEKKLQEERKQKLTVEQQLANEKKARKADESTLAKQPPPAPPQIKLECPESCRTRRKETDNELKQLRRDLKLRDEQCRQLEREAQTLRQYRDSKNDVETLMSALLSLQDKNSRLESSLSAETRHKLDLFSAYGDAKRQIEILQGYLAQKDIEIKELQLKIAEVMATSVAYSLQSSIYNNQSSMLPCSSTFAPINSDTAPIFSSRLPSHVAAAAAIEPEGMPNYGGAAYGVAGSSQLLLQSNLNPNATQYLPTSCE